MEKHVEKWTVQATYIHRKTGERFILRTTVNGSLDDTKKRSKTVFKSTKKARVMKVVVINDAD